MARPYPIPDEGRHIEEYGVAASQTWVAGSALALNASGVLVEETTQTNAILGFAAHDYPLDNDPYGGKALAFVAKDDSTFWIPGDNDPVEGDVGDEVEATYANDTPALLNGAAATSVTFHILKIDTTRKLYNVKVVEAKRQVG